MPQYNSTDKRTQTIGIAGYTIDDTVLNIIGNTTFQGDINLGDNDVLNFGANNDLQIFHDGSNSIIRDNGNGGLVLSGDGTVAIRNAAETENKAVFSTNGAVELYHDNVLKFSTTANGSDVTGTLRASTSLVTTTDDTGITITNNTIQGPSTLTIDPATTGDNTGTVVIAGDLQVDGTTTTINSTTVTVDDKNIELGSVATPSDTTADAGGITLKGTTDKTFNWINTTGSWTSSENIDIANTKTYKINAIDVLSATALGINVVTSSLTSVGTIGTGVWQGTTIAIGYGGTNGTAAPTLGAAAYGNGTAYAFTAAGTTGQVLTSNGAAAPTWGDVVPQIIAADESTDTTCFPLFATIDTGSISVKTDASGLRYDSSTETLDINNINVVTNATVKGAIRVENATSTERFEISYNETTDSLDFTYSAS